MANFLRGEIWNAELAPTRGHEQDGSRPVLIISTDDFNSSPAELVAVLPITTKDKRIRTHLSVGPGGITGLRSKSFILADQIRTISTDRLTKRIGRVEQSTLDDVGYVLRMLLEL